MMLLSRNTILTAALLATNAVVETQAEACSDTSSTQPDCGETLACTYGGQCLVGTCQYRCPAPTDGFAGNTEGFANQLENKGKYLVGRRVDSSLLVPSKAKDETEVGAVDVGAPVEAASTTTSGSASAGVASFLLLAAVGGGAAATTLIVGL